MVVRGKGGRAAYFEAAYNILAAGGADALTVTALCEQIPVTPGAFYHHFAGTAEFVTAFADHWTHDWLVRLDQARDEPDVQHQAQALARLALEMPVEQERAIRAWARTNAVVQAAVDRVDAAAVDVAEQALTEILGDPARARMLARMANALGVGLLMQGDPGDPQSSVDAWTEFVRSSMGMELTVAGPAATAVLRPVAV